MLVYSVDGSEFGAAVGLDFSTKATKEISVGILTHYSTAFDAYWSRVRIGYDFGSVTIGPEIVALGDESFDQQRYGLSITGIQISEEIGLEIAAGHSNGSRDGDSSPYANVALNTQW